MDDLYPPTVLSQAVRKSLKGDAASVLLSLGSEASITAILRKLEVLYGTVDSPETLMQAFYTARQDHTESVPSWGIRLEATLQRAIDRGSYIDPASQDTILRNRFWSGLSSDLLKNATRHAFYAGQDYGNLLQFVRAVEQELQSDTRPPKPKPRVQFQAQTFEPKDTRQDSSSKISEQLSEVIKRLDKLEVSASKPQPLTDNQVLHQILDRISALEAKTQKPASTNTSYQRGKGRGYRGNKIQDDPSVNYQGGKGQDGSG